MVLWNLAGQIDYKVDRHLRLELAMLSDPVVPTRWSACFAVLAVEVVDPLSLACMFPN